MSSKFGLPVTDLLIQRLPTTVELTLYALTFAIIVGITLGVISAYRRNSSADVGTMLIANIGVSTPVFVLGLLLAYFFAITLNGTPFELPPSGRASAGAEHPGTGGGLGPRGPLGSTPRGRRLPVEHLHVQCRSSGSTERSSSTRCGT